MKRSTRNFAISLGFVVCSSITLFAAIHPNQWCVKFVFDAPSANRHAGCREYNCVHKPPPVPQECDARALSYKGVPVTYVTCTDTELKRSCEDLPEKPCIDIENYETMGCSNLLCSAHKNLPDCTFPPQ